MAFCIITGCYYIICYIIGYYCMGIIPGCCIMPICGYIIPIDGYCIIIGCCIIMGCCCGCIIIMGYPGYIIIGWAYPMPMTCCAAILCTWAVV